MWQFIRKGLVYCFGMFFMSSGVAFSIISNLGVSPISSVPYAISVLSGIDIGVLTTMFMMSLIVVQLIILRKDFKLIYLAQIICSFIFGGFVSLTTYLTSGIDLGGNYFLSLLFCGLSIIMIGFGLSFYLAPKFVILPGEGVMQAMTTKFGLPMYASKIIFDCITVALAVAIALISKGGIFGVREGTVLAAIAVGFVLKFFQRLLSKHIQKFIGD